MCLFLQDRRSRIGDSPLLTPFGKREWITTVIVGVVVIVGALMAMWWWAVPLTLAAMAPVLWFFRDPRRAVPNRRGQIISPADGKVSSVHTLDHFEPFDGPAVCVRIFLSVLNVHVNRAPLHGRVVDIQHRPGEYLNALKPESAEVNEAVMIVLHHPTTGAPVAAVQQIAGAIARRIVCATHVGDILQRGQRYGMIKFGSTTELYLPDPDGVDVRVKPGDKVQGGATVLAARKGEAD